MTKYCPNRSWLAKLPSASVLAITLFTTLWTSTATGQTQAVDACVATYQLSLNGKTIGQLRSELKPLHNDHWQYSVDTKARRGLIKARVRQRGEFVRQDNEIRPLNFQSKQKIAFAKRESSASYDWQSMVASGRHKNKDWQLSFAPGFVDRLTLNERIRLDLKTQSAVTEFDYTRLDRGKLRPMRFRRGQQLEPLQVPAGEYSTFLMERQHDQDDRRTASWHAPDLNYFPVRMEQLDDGDLTVSELTAIEGCEQAP